LLSADKPLKVKPANPTAKPWPSSTAIQHSIVVDNDGAVVIARPDHATPRISVAHTVELFVKWAQEWQSLHPSKIPKLVIYAHGGLNPENDAIQRARVLGPYFKENGVYPIFYIWKTGFFEVLRQEAMDRWIYDPSQRLATGVFGDAFDRLIEALAHGPFRFMWRQMKQNAEAAKASDRALGLLVAQLKTSSKRLPFETHLVAHSAGAYVAGHLMDLGLKPDSLSLFAPACTLDFAIKHLAGNSPSGKTALHVLSALAEEADAIGLTPPLAYGKSLLWLVCRGFEDSCKTPLAGLAHCLDDAATQPDDDLWHSVFYPDVLAWRKWVAGLETLPGGHAPVNEVKEHVIKQGATVAGSHGLFDNDLRVMTRTIEMIVGHQLNLAIEDLSY
jgi:hypothetical protein